jgi:signal transduction histidine kinase
MDKDGVRKYAATFMTDATSPPTPRPRRLLLRGRFDFVQILDVIVALVCFAIANSVLRPLDSPSEGHHGAFPLAVFAFVTCAPLVFRTRFPLPAWVASALAVIGTSLYISPTFLSSSGYMPVVLVVYGLCLYSVAVRCRPRIVLAATVVTVLGAGFVDSGSAPEAIFLAVIPLLIGAVVRQRRSGQRQLAEQEIRHSGERALLEERQRIARELHDVVAHHMSVIAIQAEAAPYKTENPPPELVESFADIRASALAGLGELRRVLGVLRTGGRDTAPQPGLAELDTLLDSARGGGVSVAVSSTGHPVALPDGVDLSAYRIVQEALSNAMRHAPGSHVQVHVGYRPDGLALEVRNDAAPRPCPSPRFAGGGHGIIGMRERAAMLGGSLDARPTEDGGFQVSAVLPMASTDES